MKRTLSALLTLSALTGCTAALPLPVGDDHPASPSAAEGIVPQLSYTLNSDDFEVPRKQQSHERDADHAIAPEGVIYTCPMHPEIRSAQPGQCPKCGMRLVEKEPAAGGGRTGAPPSGHEGHR